MLCWFQVWCGLRMYRCINSRWFFMPCKVRHYHSAYFYFENNSAFNRGIRFNRYSRYCMWGNRQRQMTFILPVVVLLRGIYFYNEWNATRLVYRRNSPYISMVFSSFFLWMVKNWDLQRCNFTFRISFSYEAEKIFIMRHLFNIFYIWKFSWFIPKALM